MQKGGETLANGMRAEVIQAPSLGMPAPRNGGETPKIVIEDSWRGGETLGSKAEVVQAPSLGVPAPWNGGETPKIDVEVNWRGGETLGSKAKVVQAQVWLGCAGTMCTEWWGDTRN